MKVCLFQSDELMTYPLGDAGACHLAIVPKASTVSSHEGAPHVEREWTRPIPEYPGFTLLSTGG